MKLQMPKDGQFARRGDRWGDPGHFVKSHSKLYLWGVLGFPPPTFRGRVEGTNLYWAPGMECRREPWCVTKIVKTTLQVLKPSKMSVLTLKTLLVNFARLGWRDAPGGAPKAHSILGPRGGNSEKISEVTFSSFFFFSLHRQMSNFGYRHQAWPLWALNVDCTTNGAP